MPSCPNSWDATHWVPISSCRSPCHDSVSLPRRESRGQKEGGYDLHKVERSPGRGPPGWDSSCARGETQAWPASWAPQGRGAGAPSAPAGPSTVGAGCGQKPHRAQVSSLGQKGQEERRATGRGEEGWRKDGELRPRSSERRLGRRRAPRAQCSGRPRHPALSDGPGAGRSPPLFPEVVGIVTPEVSAQAQPPQPLRRSHGSALSSPGSDPATGACGVGREAGARGARDKLGTWRWRPRESAAPRTPPRASGYPVAPLRSGHPGIHMREEDPDGFLSARGPWG